MKILFSFLFLTLFLYARENPFEATETFQQKKQEYLKQIELEKEAQKKAQEAIEKEKELQKLAQQLEKEKEEKARLEKLALEEEVKRKASELQKQQEEAALKAAVEEKKKHAIKYNPLNFVKFEVYEGSLVIYIDETYKLLNVDILKPANKFLFDFEAHADFYTKRKVLEDHPLFKSITVGNHPKKGFFRVVIAVKGDIDSFEENIETEKGMITINKL
jgi:hypothetical protein